MLLKAELGSRRKATLEQESGEYRSRRGDFVGTVHAGEKQYEFAVRDMRRERPTIHGTGVNFNQAVTTVTQLLDALASGG